MHSRFTEVAGTQSSCTLALRTTLLLAVTDRDRKIVLAPVAHTCNPSYLGG
jgi:hypothetical protein